MNTGIRYISENLSQDLVYYFPYFTSRNPFHKNQSNNSETEEKDINSSVIISSFIIGILFGIIFVILKMQCQNSMLQEYLFNAQTLKIQAISLTFGFILLIVMIAIHIYRIQFKTLTHIIIGQILQPLFIISFILSAATLTYFLFIYFKNGNYLVLSSIICLFLINVVSAIYVSKKQQYKPQRNMIFSNFKIWYLQDNFNMDFFNFINFILFRYLVVIIDLWNFNYDLWLLVIHSVKFVIEEYKFKLTNQDYIIALPLIFLSLQFHFQLQFLQQQYLQDFQTIRRDQRGQLMMWMVMMVMIVDIIKQRQTYQLFFHKYKTQFYDQGFLFSILLQVNNF